MSNETPVERFVVLRSLMGMLIDSDGNRVVPTTGNVARAFECVSAADYDKLKAENEWVNGILAQIRETAQNFHLDACGFRERAEAAERELAEARIAGFNDGFERAQPIAKRLVQKETERAENAERERDAARAALAEDSTLLEKRILEYVQLQGEAAEYCYELAEAKAEHELAVMRFREVDAELAEAKAEHERLKGRVKMAEMLEFAKEPGATSCAWAHKIAAVVTAPTDADQEALVGCLVSLGLIRCTDGSDTKRECDAGDARTIFSAIADRARAPESTEKRPATDQEWAAVESEIAEHRRARAPEREGDEK